MKSHGNKTISEITSYSIFDGVELKLVHFDYQLEEGIFTTPSTIIELNHCFSGRFEICYNDRNVYHVSRGDFHMGLHDKTLSYRNVANDYRGITIYIDLEKANDYLKSHYREFGIDLHVIQEELFKNQTNYIVRSNPEIEHIFYELYEVSEMIRLPYYKIKVLEILLFLTGFSAEEENIKENYYMKKEIRKVNQIRKYISDHLDERFTIHELSKMFDISESKLKSCFKEIYGLSIYNYTRKYKMDKAMHDLRYSDRTIQAIAYQLGYANPSKFSSAFKTVFGMTPSDMKKKLDGEKREGI